MSFAPDPTYYHRDGPLLSRTKTAIVLAMIRNNCPAAFPVAVDDDREEVAA